MRKLIILLIAIGVLALAIPASAQQAKNPGITIKPLPEVKLHSRALFVVGQNRYFVLDQWPGQAMDVAPFIENDRTYVPVRYLGYGLGVKKDDIAWDGDNQVATLKLEDKTVQLTIGSKTMRVNGQDKTMDVEPLLRNGRTFLPARWVAEAFGFKVDWDPPQVLVYWPGERPPLTLDTLEAMNMPGGSDKPRYPDKVSIPRDGGGGTNTTPARDEPIHWVN